MKMAKAVLLVVFGLLVCAIAVGATISVPTAVPPPITQECYTAAVYEHVHEDVEGDPPLTALRKNLDKYREIVAEAKKQGADILVFPEHGLYGVYNNSREAFRELAEDVPGPDGAPNPCDDPAGYGEGSYLVAISCAAKTNDIFVVLNCPDRKTCDRKTDTGCPKDGVYMYNTNVAFDRKGNVVARYHKRHPYFEYFYDAPADTDVSYFDTEFGRVGNVICFDVVFEELVRLVEDHGIDTLAYPTWWFDGQPFLVSNQIQQAFAVVHGINFLAADIQWPSKGTLGSGIYAGVKGAVNFVHANDGRPKLLIGRVPSRSSRECKDLPPFSKTTILETGNAGAGASPVLEVTGFTTSLKHFAISRVSEPEGKMEVCHGAFCCRVEYRVSEASEGFRRGSEEFYLGAYSGMDDVLQHYFWAVEACVLVKLRPDWRRVAGAEGHQQTPYAASSQTVFDRVQLSGSFSTRYVYPSVLGKDRDIVPKSRWEYKRPAADDDSTSVSINECEDPILTVALYGRLYDRDPEYKQ